MLPAESFARTSNTCEPCASDVYDFGDEHAPHAAPSRRHSNDDPVSFDENENDAEVEATVPEGPLVSVVSGAVVSGTGVSTVHDRDAGDASRLPAPSRARTSNV